MDKVDEFLDSKLPNFGYALDIGANNGTFFSNSLYFEEKGWLVMCVEPNPLLADELRKARKLCRIAACGSANGKAEFVAIGGPPYPSGSGFHTEKARELFNLPPEQVRFEVDVLTINTVLEGSGFPRLDFLTVDAEYHEVEILAGCDFSKWTPKYVVAESWLPIPPFHDYMVGCGYHMLKQCAFDFIYERN